MSTIESTGHPMDAGGTPASAARAWSEDEVDRRLANGWERVQGALEKSFRFPDFHHTMAFVNAVAWIAHRADHHPDLSVHFGRCTVRYSTHDAGGITSRDFDCAAQIDALTTP
jgi:4a-hydroxytetrahydrobiopterin dehydratase